MFWDPAFEDVVRAFRETVGTGPGGALAVSVHGRRVVDVWGGTADEAGMRPWEPDTVVNVFSATKGVVAALAHLVARRGLFDLHAPVRRYWPEFAADATVADVLSHRAGLPAVREPLPPGSLYDWEVMTGALAREKPWWVPGSSHGYHAVTFGWLAGEVLRRVTGRTVRDLVENELRVPDLSIGLPARRAVKAAYVPAPQAGPLPDGSPLLAAMADPESITAKAFFNPADQLTPGLVNTARWRAAQVPASNGHAHARALDTLYARLVSGELIGAAALAEATAVRSDGPDEVLHGRTRFGLGFMLPNEVRPYAPAAGAFGHPGAGGALAFADPGSGLSLAYTPSRTIISPAGPDPRWPPIVEAAYACL
ncbi:esterase [Sphaerisporangium melleum]|uniref:Esterase n=1 Tax=Sphaerisporangium melleum TaxID=321316 RepID=A0A917QZ19_9ACTN|nr:serine hydrolase domain-containing protein [Sphaerisporangium melleum]GGK77278.1 esterase [Sphaerisporangium melleum]GII71831.1 esterase [Sphaerisporangium melleum]